MLEKETILYADTVSERMGVLALLLLLPHPRSPSSGFQKKKENETMDFLCL